MRFLLIISFVFASAAQAEVVKVTSGEHADFSRLVLTLPAAQGWRLGRTGNGYELDLDTDDARFDLSDVFTRIPKTRLTGVFADPVTGNLQLAIGCACHALPFSLDDRTIVIDLRGGAAPSGSSFENNLDGTLLPPLEGSAGTAVRPRSRFSRPTPTRTYDWLTADLPTLPAPAPFELETRPDRAEGLRESLVAQLAEGAARNVVNLALPESDPPNTDSPFLPSDLPIRITSEVGLQVGAQRPDAARMQPSGAACIPDEALDLPNWVPEDAAKAPYAGLSDALVGEFDRPQNAQIIASAKRYIYLGFGAETRALLAAFDVNDPEGDMLQAMSYLVDGDKPPTPNAFSGMTGCNTFAALWAFLADGPMPTAEVNSAGLLRAFSALPMHLRLNLGPQVAELLLQSEDTALAVQIREAMDRGGAEDTRSVALLSSDLSLAQGEPERAMQQAKEVLADPGEFEAEALVALVEATVAANEVVPADLVSSLDAMLAEHEGEARHPDLVAAHALALAGAGQFAEARVVFDQLGELDPRFWTILAGRGTNDDLLAQALQPGGQTADPAVAAEIATRLRELGFPDDAVVWQVLSGTADPGASLAQTTPQTDDAPDTRIARWNENWQQVAATEDGPWGELSSGLEPVAEVAQEVSLAAATTALTESEEARALIESLLAETAINSTQP